MPRRTCVTSQPTIFTLVQGYRAGPYRRTSTTTSNTSPCTHNTMAIIIISFSIYNSPVICALGSASLLVHATSHFEVVVPPSIDTEYIIVWLRETREEAGARQALVVLASDDFLVLSYTYAYCNY